MSSLESDTDQLLNLYALGDKTAEAALLNRYRSRLHRMIKVRLDARVSGRVDASDIIQETLILASSRLPKYAEQRPLPFYPWLRQLAIEQVIQHHRRHVNALRRSVKREANFAAQLPDHSVLELGNLLDPSGSMLSEKISQAEKREIVHRILESLGENDRNVLILRFLEQLTVAQTAEVLEQTEDAIKSRQRRALQRFSEHFTDLTKE